VTANPSTAEIKELLDQIDETPAGPEEYAMTQRAVAMAVEAGAEELEYQARIRLTSAASYNGDTDAMLSSFAWCLAKYDSDPDRFPADMPWDDNTLMWQYKWMPHALDRSPAFPLEQTEALLDDMEERYRRAGLGMSAVVAERFSHAWVTGQIDEAKRLRAVLEATPRDSHSDCEACSRSGLLAFAVRIGEDELALSLIDEIVENGYSCAEEPEYALARSLVCKLRAGRFDDAKASHTRSYRLARSNPDNLAIVADNLTFCAITGNQVRALDILERHLPWLTHNPLDDSARLTWLTAVGLTLESLERIGEAGQVIRGAARPEIAEALKLEGEPTSELGWTATDLAAKVRAAADKLAAAFDARNGNTFVSEHLATTRALLDEPYDLPIQEVGFITPPPPAPEPEDAVSLLEAVDSCLHSGRPAQAVEYARRMLELTAKALDEESPDAVPAIPDPSSVPAWAGSGSLADLRLNARSLMHAGLVDQELTDQAQAALAEFVAELRRAGLDAEAEVEEQMGLAAYSDGQAEVLAAALDRARQLGVSDERLARLSVILARKLAVGDDPESQADKIAELLTDAQAKARPGSLTQVAVWSLLADRPGVDMDGAISYIDRSLALELPRGRRAGLLRWRANCCGSAGRFEEGAANADEATRINAALGFNGPGAASAELAGRLLSDAGQLDAAAQRFRYAVRLLEAEGDPAPGPKFLLAQNMMSQGQAWEAVELFGDVLQAEREREVPGPVLADTLEWLGRASDAEGEYGAALGYWEEAADLYEEAEQPAEAARQKWRQGNLYRAFDQFDDALEHFETAMRLLREANWEEDEDLHPLVITVIEARALAKGSAGDASALEEVDFARGIALADESTWRAADLLDTKARVLHSLDRDEEAVTQFLTAADDYRAAGDWASGGGAELLAARALAQGLDRPADAKVILTSALATLAKPEAAEAAADAEGLIEALKAALAELA
jgi:tetratricopeptide (TPR) repeat protein